ncbi:Os04g0139733 [Oryza sativa Japonica Group]|uniref:Os04g0139733 protein n=1 Tax=Oryza sativa subsp. japonica TaxID=39947 RepID=A0A0P0W710_ORYSJ|nr:Os04g0139733 [Oryza sativa Japonica Group]
MFIEDPEDCCELAATGELLGIGIPCASDRRKHQKTHPCHEDMFQHVRHREVLIVPFFQYWNQFLIPDPKVFGVVMLILSLYRFLITRLSGTKSFEGTFVQAA